jgi:hypothetical protein
MPGERDTFLEIRPKLTQFRDDNGVATADLEVDPNDAELIQKILELRDQGIIQGIRAGGNLLSRSTPLSGLVTFTINTANVPGYFETWTHLIQRNPLVPPADYDVFDKTGGDEASYYAACELLGLLKQRAEVWDATQLRFFLVDRQAIEISITYSVESMASIAKHLRAVTAFLDTKHIEADSRWNFFRKAAIRVIRDTVKDARLSVMFTQLGNIIERANQDFSLYLERYSFEDALKGFDEKRLKFIADLNQVLASVQAALLAVPVGFFLVAEKIKQSAGWNGQNVIIGAGGIIFCGILLVLLRNQGRTLKEVQTGIDDFGTAQKAKNTPNALQIGTMVQNAKKHSRRILLFLRVVTGLVILFAVVIVVAVIWASKPEIQKLIPYSQTAELIPQPPAVPVQVSKPAIGLPPAKNPSTP